MTDKFYRPITHQGYKSKKVEEGLKNSFHHVPKAILRKGDEIWNIAIENIGKKRDFHFGDDKYLLRDSESKVVPIWGGGISLFGLIVFLWGEDLTNSKTWDTGMFFFIGTPLFFLLFFIFYFFTMPKKEDILNRKDGTITFPGSFWGKNITMPFSNVIFHFSTGGENAIGAYMLQIVRPTNHTFRIYSHGDDCYESISLIVWYMDKNRPLPPGTAFDASRDADFERRKAEGFPPPLYPSQVPTPEATKEQQKERDNYWRDLDYITNIKY